MLNADTLTKWMTNFETRITKEKDHLTELDRVIGDSDHGNNMERGVEAIKAAFEKTPPTSDLAQDFKTIAMAMLSKVGGASGPLYGTAFLEMAKLAKTDTDFGDLVDAAAKGIAKRGQAKTGDKTMLDVWAPAADLIKQGKLDDAAIDKLVASTEPMIAKRGRASYLGEKSVGHIDPGAASTGELLKAYLDATALVSHVPAIANGVETLIKQVAKDVPITTAGGTSDGKIGTDLDHIQKAIGDNPASELLVFYDLGSAKMNLDIAEEVSDKQMHVYDVAFVEGAYAAAALLEANVTLDKIEAQLKPLKVK